MGSELFCMMTFLICARFLYCPTSKGAFHPIKASIESSFFFQRLPNQNHKRPKSHVTSGNNYLAILLILVILLMQLLICGTVLRRKNMMKQVTKLKLKNFIYRTQEMIVLFSALKVLFCKIYVVEIYF